MLKFMGTKRIFAPLNSSNNAEINEWAELLRVLMDPKQNNFV